MIIIKNYGMPHNCYDCDIHNYHECDLTSELIEEDYCWNGDSREKHCPLREVEAIPKDQYEARLKADIVSVLEEVSLEIEELEKEADSNEFAEGWLEGVNNSQKVIKNRIDILKAVLKAKEKKDAT